MHMDLAGGTAISDADLSNLWYALYVARAPTWAAVKNGHSTDIPTCMHMDMPTKQTFAIQNVLGNGRCIFRALSWHQLKKLKTRHSSTPPSKGSATLRSLQVPHGKILSGSAIRKLFATWAALNIH